MAIRAALHGFTVLSLVSGCNPYHYPCIQSEFVMNDHMDLPGTESRIYRLFAHLSDGCISVGSTEMFDYSYLDKRRSHSFIFDGLCAPWDFASFVCCIFHGLKQYFISGLLFLPGPWQSRAKPSPPREEVAPWTGLAIMLA